MYLQKNQASISQKNNVAKLTSRPCIHEGHVSRKSAFRRTGIYPFSNTAILDSEVAPATIYNVSQNASTKCKHPDTPVSVVSESQLLTVSDALRQIISTIQLLNLLNLLMTEVLLMIKHLISSTPKRSLQLSKERRKNSFHRSLLEIIRSTDLEPSRNRNVTRYHRTPTYIYSKKIKFIWSYIIIQC